ncbi:16S rRNA (cytosine(1402)-N(4))-methyltransferase RsmH [Pseudoroseomonas cervicalis]|uniref:Ribosomal RNA small subunit methyltransferase H n=1 Tax=Pseudoroseomonas cervicalis ATCC 49957 TaxID=525371 RepID=D5RIS1_9PROT|nr:16S rRNA (cytosine(1402)-N(4))-methyltransferase RsmH [Pseudoroseomonas cervicalis]EFH12794.1 S-adenosyl-methyltransferase MraW [Pseudoroseomonas cervicalis ATCC 49957]
MSGHLPVMLAEVLDNLAPRAGGAYVDGTFGGGGYARAILGRAACTLHAFDRDPDAIARGQALLAESAGRLTLIERRFGEMREALAERGVTTVDGVVLDLGVSSFQLDQAERGFSFRFDGPLDMRMEKAGPSAADLVNTLPEAELADILWQLGEERHSRRIARTLVAARREAPIETTGRLRSLIHAVMPRDPSGIDSATRSFQALRLKVNDELGEVERGLEAAASLLAPGGRLVVVAFHSLEDRIVKRFMQQAAGRGPGASRHDPSALLGGGQKPRFRLVANNALRPGAAELAANPRARSARLRTLEKLETA